MRIALGSDEATELTQALERDLRKRGYEVETFGALSQGGDDAWPSVGKNVAEFVVAGNADSGIVCCSTGTGVSIAANKVQGARAALCGDAQTAAGARTWNDANVLALSLVNTPPQNVPQILDAWFGTTPTSDSRYRAMIDSIK